MSCTVLGNINTFINFLNSAFTKAGTCALYKIKFYNVSACTRPTEVSHLAVVVGLSTDDPKDF